MIMDASLNLLPRTGFGCVFGYIPASWNFSKWQKDRSSRALLAANWPGATGWERSWAPGQGPGTAACRMLKFCRGKNTVKMINI